MARSAESLGAGKEQGKRGVEKRMTGLYSIRKKIEEERYQLSDDDEMYHSNQLAIQKLDEVIEWFDAEIFRLESRKKELEKIKEKWSPLSWEHIDANRDVVMLDFVLGEKEK